MITNKNKLKNIEEANKKLESVWLSNKVIEDHHTVNENFLTTSHKNIEKKYGKKLRSLFENRISTINST